MAIVVMVQVILIVGVEEVIVPMAVVVTVVSAVVKR